MGQDGAHKVNFEEINNGQFSTQRLVFAILCKTKISTEFSLFFGRWNQSPPHRFAWGILYICAIMRDQVA